MNFENVGGEIMATVMRRMTLGGRMPLCGLISGYNEGTAAVGDFSPILMRRLSVRGFIVIDFAPRWEEATSQLIHWVREGKLKHRETIVEGLECADCPQSALRRRKHRQTNGQGCRVVGDRHWGLLAFNPSVTYCF